MTDRPPLTAGIIGYGYMGQIRRRNVDDHPELEVMGICDPDYDQTRFKAPAFPTFQTLIDARPDIVFVCTPNNITPEATIYALERGCHVFCEKPPGRNLRDIQRIITTEQKYPGRQLIFGFNHRHHPAVTDAKALIDGGSLGRLLWVRGVYGKSGGDNFEKSWRNDPAVGGGGILLDQGIHMLDLFRFFCGDFPEVMGMTTTAYWDIPVEDNAVVLLRSADNVLAQLHSSATLWKHTFRLEIGLEKGYLTISGLLSKTGSYGRETLLIGRKPGRGEKVAVGNPREEVIYYDNDPSWDIQVQHLVECIRENRPIDDSTSTDALRVMEIIDRVYAQAGREAQR
jgi:predicted dehydrogenase